jgi:MIP family channel proteins
MADDHDDDTTAREAAATTSEPDDRKRTQILTMADLDPIPERGPGAYIAEFVGTFFLVFFICAVATLYLRAPIQNADGSTTIPFVDYSVIGLVHLLVLFVLIQSLAVVSGAHFNPAVTAALTAIRQIRPADAGIYVICQLAGGVLGALVVKLMFENEGKPFSYGAPGVENAIAGGKVSIGFAAEFIGAFILVWTIAGVAVNPRGLAAWSGLAIGGALGLAEFIFAPVSGGAFNPARAFGPALVGDFGLGAGNWILAYVAAPVLGGLAAAAAYHFLFILPGKKGTLGMEPVG